MFGSRSWVRVKYFPLGDWPTSGSEHFIMIWQQPFFFPPCFSHFASCRTVHRAIWLFYSPVCMVVYSPHLLGIFHNCFEAHIGVPTILTTNKNQKFLFTSISFFFFFSALFFGGLANFSIIFFIIIDANSTLSHLGM